MTSKYIWNTKDITFEVLLKIEHVVRLIAQKEGKSFDDVYADFLYSKTYSALQRVQNDYWAESAEFLVDEYYREKAGLQ